MFSILCSHGCDSVRSHIWWNSTLQHSSAKSHWDLSQLLLLPARLSGPHVFGWVSRSAHLGGGDRDFVVDINLFIFLFGFLFRTFYQLSSPLQAEEEAFLHQEEESELKWSANASAACLIQYTFIKSTMFLHLASVDRLLFLCFLFHILFDLIKYFIFETNEKA